MYRKKDKSKQTQLQMLCIEDLVLKRRCFEEVHPCAIARCQLPQRSPIQFRYHIYFSQIGSPLPSVFCSFFKSFVGKIPTVNLSDVPTEFFGYGINIVHRG